MNHLVEIISKRTTIHLIFFFTLISLTIYTFSSVVNITFGEWEWMELEYHIRDIPPATPKFLYWLNFYLRDQYGTTYALIGLAGLIFKSSMTGHYLMNVFLRLIAAISIYLFANWWTGKKSIGFIAGIFFIISLSGIENTIWVIQFVAYIAVILFLTTLYFWRRFHNNPSIRNLKLSVLFFGLTIFISHVRLYALPFIILMGEVYTFFHRVKDNIYSKLIGRHIKILLLILLAMFLTSSSLHVTSQVLKTVSPSIILKSLASGYPPLIHSFFLFIGNTIFPSPIIGLINSYTNTLLDFGNLGKVSTIISGISIMPLVINIVKRNYYSSLISLLAVTYPLSLYWSKDNLQWEPSQLASTALAGSLFFLFILMLLKLQKIAPKTAELGWLGIIIIISHLFLPWLAFPLPEANVQAAYPPSHRYYTVPIIGMSFLWGIIFTYFGNSLSGLNFSKKSLSSIFKILTSSIVLLLIVILFIANIIITRNTLIGRTQNFDKSRDTQLWNLVKPVFIDLDRQKDWVVYIEGDLSENDKSIVLYLLRHHLINELGYGKPGNKYNVTFLIDKNQTKRLFEKDASLYIQYNLSSSFSESDFMAFRVNGNYLEDIRDELLREVKTN